MAVKKPDTAASLWGAGAGTGFLGLVQALPETFNTVEPLLTFSTPIITVVVSALWLVIGERFRQRKFREGVRKAKLHRDEILEDPNSSPALRKKASESYESLADLVNDIICDETRLVGVSLAARNGGNGKAPD